MVEADLSPFLRVLLWDPLSVLNLNTRVWKQLRNTRCWVKLTHLLIHLWRKLSLSIRTGADVQRTTLGLGGLVAISHAHWQKNILSIRRSFKRSDKQKLSEISNAFDKSRRAKAGWLKSMPNPDVRTKVHRHCTTLMFAGFSVCCSEEKKEEGLTKCFISLRSRWSTVSPVKHASSLHANKRNPGDRKEKEILLTLHVIY